MQPTFASPHLRHRSPIKLVSNAPPSWLEGFANRLMVAAFDPRFDPDGREFKCPICQYFLTLVPNPDKKSNDNLGEIGFFFLFATYSFINLFVYFLWGVQTFEAKSIKFWAGYRLEGNRSPQFAGNRDVSMSSTEDIAQG